MAGQMLYEGKRLISHGVVMKQRTEALRNELRAIEIWDQDYEGRSNPPFIDTEAWKARRQRAAEIQSELRQLEAAFLASPDEGAGANLAKPRPDSHDYDGLVLRNRSDQGTSCTDFHKSFNHKAAQLHQLGMAVEQAGESIIITDADGLITYVNPAFERTTGYTLNELLGQHPRVFKSGAHSQSFYEALWATLKRGDTWRGRFINKRKDGTLFHEEASISPVVNNAGGISGYVAVKRDITRETDLEQQFHAAQRMEAVGQLASGIAHDFNNLLAAILGNVELLEETAGTNQTVRDRLTVVRQAANRATGLIRQLLAFSRRQALQPEVLNLNEVVNETVTMLGRLLGDNIGIVTHLTPQLFKINADAGQLQQTILNLAINARDAMPEGGTLTIATSNVELTDEYLTSHRVVQPGKYVLLSVGDSGTGMTHEVQSRIFEPFFTTKPKGKGTGLGLATVYGIVKQSGGYIWVYSEVGRGSIFKIYLPKTERLSAPQGTVIASNFDKRSAKLNGAVLVVEDDSILRELIGGFLKETGLTVVEASCAEDALLIPFPSGKAPRLLVTDHVLQGKDGVTLAIELRSRFPELKVILMSGYIDHGLPDPQTLKEARFLSKPFSRRQLQEEVMSVLE